jgi:hypothetical protein
MTSNEANITKEIKTLKTFKVGGENQLIIQHGYWETPDGLAGVVPFATAFAEPPNIICSVVGDIQTELFTVNIDLVSATGFRYRVRRFPNSLGGVGGAANDFYYRAIGKKVV